MTHSDADLSVRQTLVRYYFVWLIYSFAGAFLFGVYPLFLRSRGLTPFQINLVLATYFAVTFFSDTATGAFADLAGRRVGFVIGCVLRIISFITYFFAHSFLLFVIAEAIDGIGTTFGNGTIDSWAVDRLDRSGFAPSKDSVFARGSQFANLTFMVGAVIGGYVADRDIAAPWLLGAGGYVLAAFCGAASLTGESEEIGRISLGAIAHLIPARLRDGVRRGFSNRAILLLSIASAIIAGIWIPIAVQWPAYFESGYGIGVQIVGWVFSIFMIGRIAGAQIVIRQGPHPARRAGLLALAAAGIAIALFVAASGGIHTNLVLACLFAVNLLSGVSQPLVQAWFNEEIDASDRALLLSFQTTFVTLGNALSLIVNGLIVRRWGLMVGWCSLGFISFGAVACFVALRKHPLAGAQSGRGKPLQFRRVAKSG